MRFRGVLFERLGAFGARVESTFDVPWAEADILGVFGEQAPSIEKDAQQLWAAADYLPKASRGLAGLNALYAAVLDCDCADVGQLDVVVEHLRARRLAAVVYTSWSHADPGKVHKDTQRRGPFDAFRVVLPYSRPVTKDEHAAIVPALLGHEIPADPQHYAQEVLGRFVVHGTVERAARPRGWDPASARPAQAYYVPSPRSSLDYLEGAPVDVEAVLQRPGTARVVARRLRPYQAPNSAAVGALGRVLQVFRDRGHWHSQSGYEGWHRAACPACAPEGSQKSPSFVVRANGDGIDLRCYSGCSRTELLSALGLDEGGVFRPPSNLRLGLDEQIAGQAPPTDAIDVLEAVQRLEGDIREAVESRDPSIIQYPAGTGKSYAAAKILAEQARAGYRVVYATQEHAVAYETRSLLPPDIRARSVHIHSPLVQVQGEALCRRADELRERVFEFGVSLLGQVCPRCIYRETCQALAEARGRQEKLTEASVIFVSHAGIGQVFGPDKGHDLKLIVDEMPSVFEEVKAEVADVRKLAEGVALPSAPALVARAAQEIARAWTKGEPTREISWGPGWDSEGTATEIAQKWRRCTVTEHAHPSPAERQWLEVADAVIRLEAARAEGLELRVDSGAVSGFLPDAAHDALVTHRGVLLSATPLRAALPGFTLREASVRDSATVVRRMYLARDRGSMALTKMQWDDETRSMRTGVGTPWGLVHAALARARAEAQKYECKRVLFVTFKAIADVMRTWDLPDVSVGHYGALRGKNDWMEGAAQEVSVAYLFGTPRFDVRNTLSRLGLIGQAADDAWRDYAAGELTQAEGRLRLPRRRKPCSVLVEGSVAPSTWHEHNIDEIVEVHATNDPLQEALWWRGREGLARAAGVRREQVDRWLEGEPYPSIVERLAAPSVVEAMDLLVDIPKRVWDSLSQEVEP